MKNIHVLPTDKPSRLYLSDYGKELNLSGYPLRKYTTGQNIYITSDEEIKEGDYRLNIQRDYFKKSDKEGLDYYNKRNDIFKKIILTTDQDLVKNGVQTIDDEFLEWFVKNPSCDKVEVENIILSEGISVGYEIQIPEEIQPQQIWNEEKMEGVKKLIQKQKLIEIIKSDEELGLYEAFKNIPEPNDKLKKAFRDFGKKETLEEAGERLYPTTIDSFTDTGVDMSETERLIFTNGAKWQQEQIGKSEFLQKLRATMSDAEARRLIFEQFKK